MGDTKAWKELYGTIIVPPAVRSEIEVGRQQGIDVPNVDNLVWIHIRQAASIAFVPALTDLGPGAAEVIALGLEMSNGLLILDDQLARRIADVHDLNTGTLGVLVRAKQVAIWRLYEPQSPYGAQKVCGSAMRLKATLRLSGE